MVSSRRRGDLSTMAPGTNSMLRTRRKDKDVRPNRLLDRTASRGMLYENEDLRLRTININADLEKGQQYIKKLRRENGQLRREIWSLRDQYDKLEGMIRNQEQEAREECNEVGYETDAPETLSIVAEESENEDSKTVTDAGPQIEKGENSLESVTESLTHSQGNDLSKQVVALGTVIEMVTLADLTNTDVTQFGIYSKNDTASHSLVDDKSKMCSLKTCEEVVEVFRKNATSRRSLVFSIRGLENLTVQEVIDCLEQELKDDCHNIVTGVRLTRSHGFISVKEKIGCEHLLQSTLQLRDKSIKLEDVWDCSTILQLSAVPHHVIDEQIVATITRFADVIGNVERQAYKGLDTGERFVHVKTPGLIPYQLLIGSVCIPVTLIYPNQERFNTARRKSFRSQMNINLKTPTELEAEETSPKLIDSLKTASQESIAKQDPEFFSKSTGITLSPQIEANVFQFPNQGTSNRKSNSGQHSNAANITKEQSPSAFRRFAQRSVNSFRRHQNNENSQPPSPVVFPNTPKLGRRSSVNFRNADGGGRSRAMDGYYEYGSSYMRERSASDASSGRQSICRRKLSVTGYEGRSKIPWCGCWGIGCC